MCANAQGSLEAMIVYQDWLGLVGNHQREENVVKSSQYPPSRVQRPRGLLTHSPALEWFIAHIQGICSFRCIQVLAIKVLFEVEVLVFIL